MTCPRHRYTRLRDALGDLLILGLLLAGFIAALSAAATAVFGGSS
jgi:hypothetical protein